MTNGSWIVMFPKARRPTEADTEAALNKIRNATVTKVEEMEFTVAAGKASFDVAFEDASWVVTEAKELVERNGGSLANREEVATYDARFELNFDQRDMGDLFNQVLSAAEKLAKLTGGVIYEVDNGVFQ